MFPHYAKSKEAADMRRNDKGVYINVRCSETKGKAC